MAGNVLVGGLIGVAIDAGSGATKELKPNPLVVKLVQIAAKVAEDAAAAASSAPADAAGATSQPQQ
jgi:hypothetical protein